MTDATTRLNSGGAQDAVLEVRAGAERWAVRPGSEFVIGRGSDADARVDGADVSRRHAVIRHTPEGWLLEDLSSNGTYCDGTRIYTMIVASHRRITLGPDGPAVDLLPVKPPTGLAEAPPNPRLGHGWQQPAEVIDPVRIPAEALPRDASADAAAPPFPARGEPRPAMSYCGQCGAPAAGAAEFCGRCGSPMATRVPAEAPPLALGHVDESGVAPVASGRLPASTLLLSAGGVLLILGAMLPWVTVGGLFSVSGVTARYGIGTLAVGLVALVAAFGAGRVYSASTGRRVVAGTALLGLAAFVLALLVTFRIRDAIAESESNSAKPAAADTPAPDTGDAELDKSLDEFGKSIAEAFKAGTGIGVYTTGAGGLLVLAGGIQAFRRATPDRRAQGRA